MSTDKERAEGVAAGACEEIESDQAHACVANLCKFFNLRLAVSRPIYNLMSCTLNFSSPT